MRKSQWVQLIFDLCALVCAVLMCWRATSLLTDSDENDWAGNQSKNSVLSGYRAPASSDVVPRSWRSDLEILSLNCLDQAATKKQTTVAHSVRLSAQICGKNKRDLSRVIASLNGVENSMITFWNKQKPGLSTDFFYLNPGVNKLKIDYYYGQKKQPRSEYLTIERLPTKSLDDN